MLRHTSLATTAKVNSGDCPSLGQGKQRGLGEVPLPSPFAKEIHHSSQVWGAGHLEHVREQEEQAGVHPCAQAYGGQDAQAHPPHSPPEPQLNPLQLICVLPCSIHTQVGHSLDRTSIQAGLMRCV